MADHHKLTNSERTVREFPNPVDQVDRELQGPAQATDHGKAPRQSPPQPRRKQTMSSSSSKEPASKAKKKKSVKQLGDFKLMKKLGKGGMGEVFLARQVSLDRLVALKVLSKELGKREDFVKRFIREARSMAKLDHQNVVKVYAVDSDRGIHFAAIEYIDGKSGQDWLDKLGNFSVGDALHITLACATGLKAAHDQTMVHRDIKPDNILITKKGVVKVADFGLAKARDEDVSMTQSGTGLGTPLYMAPEQARSAKHVDERSDIYALGATLYHMLTGKLPFAGNTALELIMAKEEGSFQAARKENNEVPERLDLMLDKMLAKDPAHRYSGCDEIIADLTSLQLANPTLTFIDGAEPTGIGTAVPGGSTVAASQRVTRGGVASSRVDANRQQAEQVTEKIWYVQHNDERGKKTLSKMTTAQLLQAIRKGVVDAKSRAKTSVNDEFVPVAQFTEFTDAIEKRIVRKQAETKATSMQQFYKQIDKAEKRRHQWRFFRNITNSFVGYVTLIVYLAIIAAIIAAVWMWGQDAFRWAADKIGLG